MPEDGSKYLEKEYLEGQISWWKYWRECRNNYKNIMNEKLEEDVRIADEVIRQHEIRLVFLSNNK